MSYGKGGNVIVVGISTVPASLSGHLLGIRKIPVDISNTDMGKLNPFNVPPEIFRLRSIWDVPSFAAMNIERANRNFNTRDEMRDIDIAGPEIEYANKYLHHLREYGMKRMNQTWWKKASYQPGFDPNVKRIDYCFMDYDRSPNLPSLRSVAAMVFGEWLMGEQAKQDNLFNGYKIEIVHEGEIPTPAPGDRKTPLTKNTTQY